MVQPPPPPPPHVLIFPVPVQGHVKPMLKLAELLAIAGVKVTFLNSDHNHERLVKYTDIHTRFAQNYPGFRFETISDGLSPDHPRSGERVMEMYHSMIIKTKPLLKELLLRMEPRVDCIIGDGIMSYAKDVSDEVGIPFIYFRTAGACCFWVNFWVPNMIAAGELPINGNEDMDRLITSVPGMEKFLRCRDLPSFCRATDINHPTLQGIISETLKTPQAQALILNTFEDLEGPILSHIRTKCPNIYTIGPLHQHLKSRILKSNSSSVNSLFEIDRSCITWLDKQPPKSVVYVSFGSLTIMKREKLMEFWYGLVNSKKRFLWVVRPDLVIDGEDKIPEELEEGTKEKGYMVGWAPQEEVLSHFAVGGFLTHSGWNSTLESMGSGIPMICWPYFADQQVNSRFVSEVWKLGLDMKDVCDRYVVEKSVNDLMVDRRDEFVKSANKMANLAKLSVSEGGSSYCNLDRLIEDIRSMSVRK